MLGITNHEAPYYAVSSSSLLTHASEAPLCFRTPSAYALHSVREKVSHPFKAGCKVKLLYALFFVFLDSKRKDKIFWTEW
jgi:hypothetical protein